MTFDWFVLVAQLINFAVLLVLLRLFLYRPIQNVIAQREERIMAVQAEAEAARADAHAAREGVRREREALEEELRLRRADAAREGKLERERRLELVELELAEARAAAERALERDRNELVMELTQRTSQLVVTELRRALAQLADTRLEAETVTVMKRRVSELDDATRTELREAAAGEEIVITTAFPVTADVKTQLSAIAAELAAEPITPSFEVDPALIFGAVMRFGAYRVGWEAEGFVHDLERALTARSERSTALGAEVDETHASELDGSSAP